MDETILTIIVNKARVPTMRALRPLLFLALTAPLVAMFACGEDEATVRPGPDAGTETIEAGEETSTAECGITIPDTYESPGFETNAAQELALRAAFRAFQKPMQDVEAAVQDGGTPMPPTKQEVIDLWQAGTPSVHSITTPYLQGRIDGWLTEYEAAGTGAWTPSDPPPATGGIYGRWVVSATGYDLRQGIEKGSFGGAFYNHALAIVAAGGFTEGTVDRLVAIFGAHPSFPNNPAAPVNPDVFAASYAARRDSKDPANPGPYQKIKRALITAKAAIAAGEKCNADRDAAFRTFFEEWEKSNYGTVVFYINNTQTRLGAGNDNPAALHAYGEAVSFILGFKTVPATYRKITDAQIDDLLTKAFYAEGSEGESYKLVTNSAAAVLQLGEVITTIKSIYGFSDAEITAFKTNF